MSKSDDDINLSGIIATQKWHILHLSDLPVEQNLASKLVVLDACPPV